jgi:hypothetical protein
VPEPSQQVTTLDDAYRAFADVVRGLDDEASWTPTGCTGWAARDLVFHCLGDAQRALVALHTPSGREPDRDAVSYWADWTPGGTGAANGRRWARVSASMFGQWPQLRDLHLETLAAVRQAAASSEPGAVVATQGHALGVDDLLSTLAVEATVHHLDLVAHLPSAPRPAASGLREVRRVLDGLLGRPEPVGWDDVRYALVGTGRAELAPAERERLGADADRLPLFG